MSERVHEAIGMVQHIYPDSHGFSKRYVLDVLITMDKFLKGEAKVVIQGEEKVPKNEKRHILRESR